MHAIAVVQASIMLPELMRKRGWLASVVAHA
jgi:hypothetical protein